jgi:hypothetical protein
MNLLDVVHLADSLDASKPSVRSMLRAAEREGLVTTRIDPVTGRTLYFAECDFQMLANGQLVKIDGPKDLLPRINCVK